MLDLAFGLTPTSRLGCQIIITEDLDGLTVTVPAETFNQLLGYRGGQALRLLPLGATGADPPDLADLAALKEMEMVPRMHFNRR